MVDYYLADITLALVLAHPSLPVKHSVHPSQEPLDGKKYRVALATGEIKSRFAPC